MTAARGEVLRSLRCDGARHVLEREAALALGIRVVELREMESGRLPLDDTTWKRVEQIIRALAATRKP